MGLGQALEKRKFGKYSLLKQLSIIRDIYATKIQIHSPSSIVHPPYDLRLKVTPQSIKFYRFGSSRRK